MGLLVVVLLCSSFACGLQTDSNQRNDEANGTVLSMADTQFMGLLPFYVADMEGFFRSNGIRLTWIDIREPGEAVRVFLAGDSDIVISTFAGLLPAEIRKPGTLKLFLPVYEASSQPSSSILVRPGSAIKTLADLRGRRMGTYIGGTQRAYAVQVLSKAGFKVPKDVDIVQVATAAQVQSLLGGAFDALFTVEPHVSIAESQGAMSIIRGVRPGLIADPFWVGAVALHADFVEENPASVARLNTALQMAVTFIQERPDKARQILAQRMALSNDVASKCGLYAWQTNLSEKDIGQIQAEVDSLKEAGQLASVLDVRPLFVIDNAERDRPPGE